MNSISNPNRSINTAQAPSDEGVFSGRNAPRVRERRHQKERARDDGRVFSGMAHRSLEQGYDARQISQPLTIVAKRYTSRIRTAHTATPSGGSWRFMRELFRSRRMGGRLQDMPSPIGGTTHRFFATRELMHAAAAALKIRARRIATSA